MAALAGLVPIAYFILGLFQVWATFSGVQHFLEVHWIVAGAISLIVGYLPLIGTVAGVYGAVSAWHWPLTHALALFFGPTVIMALIFFAAEFTRRRA